ncbi:Protein of unknown function [Propionibacterium freudenreichii]|nr:Protein of unknown function [Propionibacterium freudenreichii subsp. freudenreichii]CEG87394.1 Protein of unknown function [Propionibacterium freudenreichii]CEG89712.1 Protein of unknown function [Propionibacterium freudenreichii]CEG91302.1 Protein of unknown function [Propionibacterium freudenreichii]CEG92708.1 Protein of unknown function [Propionibacterium freudenreichii]
MRGTWRVQSALLPELMALRF